MSKTEAVIFQLNKNLKRKFKAKVATEGTNMTEKLTELIKNYVESR